uniref:Uncharacterized protein n=1 Tax=Arundo donax TaxID=35708 RepID=A0A0A8YDZ4_ARUDO
MAITLLTLKIEFSINNSKQFYSSTVTKLKHKYGFPFFKVPFGCFTKKCHTS